MVLAPVGVPHPAIDKASAPIAWMSQPYPPPLAQVLIDRRFQGFDARAFEVVNAAILKYTSNHLSEYTLF
jgi:hypothetical protein